MLATGVHIAVEMMEGPPHPGRLFFIFLFQVLDGLVWFFLFKPNSRVFLSREPNVTNKTSHSELFSEPMSKKPTKIRSKTCKMDES